MSELRFEWDVSKNRANLRKHDVDFEEARSVFYDQQGRLIDDPDHSQEEERFILLGLSSNLRLLVVCHVYHKQEVIRLISARKATRKERKIYEEYLK